MASFPPALARAVGRRLLLPEVSSRVGHAVLSLSLLSLQNCDLTGCDLQHANLRGSNLAGAVFKNIIAPLHMSQTVNVNVSSTVPPTGATDGQQQT